MGGCAHIITTYTTKQPSRRSQIRMFFRRKKKRERMGRTSRGSVFFVSFEQNTTYTTHYCCRFTLQSIQKILQVTLPERGSLLPTVSSLRNEIIYACVWYYTTYVQEGRTGCHVRTAWWARGREEGRRRDLSGMSVVFLSVVARLRPGVRPRPSDEPSLL